MKIDLSVANLNTLVVTVLSTTVPEVRLALADQPNLTKLQDVFKSDAVDHLLVVLEGEFATESLHRLAACFPRRLNGGRVAVVCESLTKGRAFASQLTVPLLPRPVRIFSISSSHDAMQWVTTGEIANSNLSPEVGLFAGMDSLPIPRINPFPGINPVAAGMSAIDFASALSS